MNFQLFLMVIDCKVCGREGVWGGTKEGWSRSSD